MTKIIFLKKALYKSVNIDVSNTFEDEFNNSNIPKNQKRRMLKFFSKRSPGKFLRLREKEGYSTTKSLQSLFAKRFGKYLVLYRIKNIAGILKLALLDLVKILTKNLVTVATHLKNKAEGGETIFYSEFEVYTCYPSLCVDPLGCKF